MIASFSRTSSIITPCESQNTDSITFDVDPITLTVRRDGESACFHCMKSIFVSGRKWGTQVSSCVTKCMKNSCGSSWNNSQYTLNPKGGTCGLCDEKFRLSQPLLGHVPRRPMLVTPQVETREEA